MTKGILALVVAGCFELVMTQRRSSQKESHTRQPLTAVTGNGEGYAPDAAAWLKFVGDSQSEEACLSNESDRDDADTRVR
jgi:hypothetical protein